MTVTVDDELDVVDMITELTQPHTHREHYTYDGDHGTSYGLNHTVKAPPLLHQLEHGSPSGQGTDRAAAGYESRPAARLEAIDTLVRIDLEAARWVRDLGEDDPGSTVAVVQLLGSLLPSTQRCDRPTAHRNQAGHVDCCTWHAIEVDVRRWWTQARIVAGWDEPAWRPDATCPVCGIRGSLRVRLSARSAMCAGGEGPGGRHIECGTVWTPRDLDQLAMHIRVETFEARNRGRSTPCWCPLPAPTLGLVMLCPRCGSSRCHHAVEALNLAVMDVLAGATTRDLARRHGLGRATAVELVRRVRYEQQAAS